MRWPPARPVEIRAIPALLLALTFALVWLAEEIGHETHAPLTPRFSQTWNR